MKNFVRARSQEAKAERQADILSAAAAELDAHGCKGVTLKGIAFRAGVVKSNVYRYFESREHVLLNVLISDLAKQNDEFRRDCVAPMSIDAVADTLSECYARNPRVCTLISELAPTLETNISVEACVAVKREILELFMATAQTLLEVVPQLPAERASAFLQAHFCMIAGMWPVANFNEDVAKVLAMPEFELMRLDFAPVLRTATRALLHGYVKAAEPARTAVSRRCGSGT
ncbi:TetR/AcrR family transcriptional regulator [Polycladidibacter hongkongensis]|uniref:TetR/AcrR family transcriptional regulator n=1 Tax=Polycladidibacter hongkongensis TaxID=1647556 RepID=UPI000B24BCFB|nr:TetR family transcriptional regulator [Pseudovibrio hongkongensis]